MRKRFCKCVYRPVSAGLLLIAVLGLNPTFAKAGPCSADIAQFELAIHQSAGNPYAGLTAPQSVAAQNDRQPTVASMKKAERDLKAKIRRDDGASQAARCAERPRRLRARSFHRQRDVHPVKG